MTGCLFRFAVGARQQHQHGGATFQLADQACDAACLLRDAIDLAQAKAGAAPGLFRGEERIERARGNLGCHAGAGVAHADFDIGTGCQIGIVLDRDVARADGQDAAARHRVARIDRQIEHRRFQLRRVGQRVAGCFQRQHKFDRRAQGPFQNLVHRPQRVADRDRLQRDFLRARESQQLTGEARAAFGGAQGVGDQPRRACVMHMVAHDIQRSDHRLQQIVEIVRDAAGQLSQRLHLLRLAQLRFGAFQRQARFLFACDVATDRVKHPGFGDRDPRQVPPISIGGAQPSDDDRRRFAAADFCHRVGGGADIVRVAERPEWFVEQLGVVIAEQLRPSRVDAFQNPVERHHRHQVARPRPDPVAFARALRDAIFQGQIQLL
ncbi:hypothetical protein TMPK1_30950 [Rhodospirillales bacterium TMPK1]|uniref:Uncharacterized protein n=1 Tax=Roseiterribacter gracilis TaxID=2812848 RepID=A0A8S8XA25_9PROT|nr:hypothetical protein TMPK1_30950 [Rhodospirillales bacterium TMPK1]